MIRKSFYVESNTCVLCDDNVIETMDHLFFACPLSQNFWWRIGFEWDIELDVINMLINTAQTQVNNAGFKETIILGCWSIWNHRNKIIFDNEERHLDNIFYRFLEYFHLVRHRAKPSLREGMSAWLDTL
ncbi:hypothetical protein BRADI_1g06864v3 [Brachypodium distachyon]|uniref:Reverse transcriptase zinc-binding domain-containing protein n=1 Tax=Brachypodium distachyon TaxID=15368 RepID=A0A2K2DID7_BRADI|nr:hypothetical protein BRADI_1g06864v3 [Brachypodium distachyon]